MGHPKVTIYVEKSVENVSRCSKMVKKSQETNPPTSPTFLEVLGLLRGQNRSKWRFLAILGLFWTHGRPKTSKNMGDGGGIIAHDVFNVFEQPETFLTLFSIYMVTFECPKNSIFALL